MIFSSKKALFLDTSFSTYKIELIASSIMNLSEWSVMHGKWLENDSFSRQLHVTMFEEELKYSLDN